jgi:ABC-type phosphate transport system substrate-binding protein
MAALPASAEIVVIVSQKNLPPVCSPASRRPSSSSVNQPVAPVDQPESSHIRCRVLKIADKDPAQVKALWSKLVFTGKATPPKEYANSAEVKKAVAADPKAIGYIDKSAVDDTVNHSDLALTSGSIARAATHL